MRSGDIYIYYLHINSPTRFLQVTSQKVIILLLRCCVSTFLWWMMVAPTYSLVSGHFMSNWSLNLLGPATACAVLTSFNQLIDLREKLQEHPIFHGKIYGFRWRFSLSRQPIDSSSPWSSSGQWPTRNSSLWPPLWLRGAPGTTRPTPRSFCRPSRSAPACEACPCSIWGLGILLEETKKCGKPRGFPWVFPRSFCSPLCSLIPYGIGYSHGRQDFMGLELEHFPHTTHNNHAEYLIHNRYKRSIIELFENTNVWYS